MYIFLGQTDVKRSESELRRLILSIEKDGLGTKVLGCSAYIEKLDGLSWSLAIKFRIKDILEQDLSDPQSRSFLEILKRSCQYLGWGKYYFRGVDFEYPIDSFWDDSKESISFSYNLFNGLPLSITIGQQNIIEIYKDWMDMFLEKHYSCSIKPMTECIGYEDPLRNMFDGLSNFLCLKGDWFFKFSSRSLIPTAVTRRSPLTPELLPKRFDN